MLYASCQLTNQQSPVYSAAPISSNKSLFQLHAEKIFAASRRYGRPIPFLIMTSHATHADTVDYFEANRYFKLSK